MKVTDETHVRELDDAEVPSIARATPSSLTAIMGDSAPHLTLFTICLLLLLYGYEIFNFSLSIDEELYGSVFEHDWWLVAIAQGRWGMGLLARVFPRFGDIPVVATTLFCAGLGISTCILARVLFRNHSAQLAFVALCISSPLWPHLIEFNTTSWGMGIACVLLTFSLLFFLARRRFGDLWATVLLTAATGIYQSFYIWFFVLLCIRHLSVLLGTAPVGMTESTTQRFPWLRIALIGLGGLLGYFAVGRLLLTALSLKLTYVQEFVRLEDFATAPALAFARALQRAWLLLSGTDPIFLGYGHILILLPLVGLVILLVDLFWARPLRVSQRLLGAALLVSTLTLALSLILISAGSVPARAVLSWIPLNAFLGGVAFSHRGRFQKLLYGVLAATLLISIWVSVSLFYTDHLARQRDQFLAARIMNRVDNIVPNPPATRVPFVVVGAVPAKAAGPFRKLEVFGDSFFDSSHEGGNPWRVAAYLRLLGVDSLEPRPIAAVASNRQEIEAMPVWPAAGSVAMVNGMLVIKLGPLLPG